MDRIVLKSKVSRDGVLHLDVAVGSEDADRMVQVTIEPSTAAADWSREEWEAWVDSMAGSWQGDFERPPQGEFEDRDPLS